MARTRKKIDESPIMTLDAPAAPENAQPDRERIAQRAYELYEARGGEHGRELEDWLAAERELVGSGSGGDR